MSEAAGGDQLSGLRRAVQRATLADESATVAALVAAATAEGVSSAETAAAVAKEAHRLVDNVRAARSSLGSWDDFLSDYGLSNREGLALMSVAEALLRIPDQATADLLLRDKILGADWARSLGRSRSLLTKAASAGLLLAGWLVQFRPAPTLGRDSGSAELPPFDRALATLGETTLRRSLNQAMQVLGSQFVLGRTITEAMAAARPQERRGWRYSYDPLGESARTAADAARHLAAYHELIKALAAGRSARDPEYGPGLSLKLSALHPRFEPAQRERVLAELRPRLLELAQAARAANLGVTIDAEEASQLELTLDLFESVFADPSLAGWDGFGIVVQAYQKRALAVVGWLEALAQHHGRRIMVRLVKGAYWDSEIKHAQEQGLPGYPVFTRKASTDLSYLVCAQRLLARRDLFFPQFATHNAHTVAAVMALAGDRTGYEFQRLHGMGEPLYRQVVTVGGPGCRIYGPVGPYQELLPYLVRRLLENGATSSFVHRLSDRTVPVAEIIADPLAKAAADPTPHPQLPLPAELYGEGRRNSAGLDLADPLVTEPLLAELAQHWGQPAAARPLVAGKAVPGAFERPVLDPADHRRTVGTVVEAGPEAIEQALATTRRAFRAWSTTPAGERADILEHAADLYERDRAALIALIVREAGRTLPDAVAEVREAVDFLRYYAGLARRDFAAPVPLPGPTGEFNQLTLHGRGTFLCISPWNFPLAIFTGQIAAALAAGNSVIAKPADQTPLVADRAVRLLLEAGLPPEVIALLPGSGQAVGAPLVADPRIAGVAFTGSTATARAINLSLAQRPGPLVPLIAETGGLNALVVDSSALVEQVVDDIITSAFRSAGQRCSSLRVLFLQEEIAEPVIAMLKGAAEQLRLGDPGQLATDVGPVIDAAALERLHAHVRQLPSSNDPLFALELPEDCRHGSFFAPRAYAIDDIARVPNEVFGPVLHVVRYAANQLEAVLDSIEATGYGLTLGVHSRIEQTQKAITDRVAVGNRYVNRSIIGAVVGSQPFGGEGLSGTGFKAGGPHYLLRFATERTLTINTTAAGGNAALVAAIE